MKTVFLKPRFKGLRLHSLYEELVKHPPDDYSIIVSKNYQKSPYTKVTSKHHNYLYKQLIYNFGSLPYIISQLRESSIPYENYDLIFASQHVLNSKKPWLTDLEFSNALTGYCNLTLCKNVISKKLNSKSCKAILPWSKWAENTLLKALDCKNFENKINVVRYTVSPKTKPRSIKKDEKIRILFMGSNNPANIHSFEFKGLYETIDAFIELQRKYDNLELVVRSIVPSDIKKKVKKFSNIKIIEESLSERDLEKLYQSSDIFPHSGFEVMNLSVLEAMSYGIPVIATSLYNTPEAIQHMKNGILIELPNPRLFYTKHDTPNDFSKSFLNHMRALRPYMREKLVKYMALIIGDSALRHKIGREAELTIREGEFSLKKRNSLLKTIFDEATQ